MNRGASKEFFDNERLLNHLKEHSYYIKDLNRNPDYLKKFISDMKVIYKERTSDKINEVVDGAQMISDILDTIK